MKKLVILLVLPLLLLGCGAQETFETLSDQPVELVLPRPSRINVRLPDGAVAPVLDSDSQQVYTAEDYEIIVQTMPSGDLENTIRTVCGYEKENLTIVETESQNVSRYEFVWTAAGEEGDRLGQAVILDDGNYHYCLSVLRDAYTKQNTQIVWSDVFQSFELA